MMMKKTLCFVLGMLFVVLGFAANKRFDTIVTFGDSLSDTGNLYHYMWNKFPISPPYSEGRFSNGPVWSEQLYDSFFSNNYTQGFQNYAVGGAGAVLSYKEMLPFTIGVELNDYFYWHTYGKKDTSLYIIWIGANNYILGPTNFESITDSVVAAIGEVAERIIKKGGNKFFIANLPDLGRVPQSADLNIQQRVTRLVTMHNRKLAIKVEELKLKYPEATIVYFDTFAFFNEALDKASDFGFSNLTDPCYLGSYSGWLLNFKPDDPKLFAYLQQQDPQFTQARWDMIKNNPELREAASASYIYHLLPLKNKLESYNCDGYVFWDRVHPTTRTHSFIAQKARQILDEAGLQAFIPIQ